MPINPVPDVVVGMMPINIVLPTTQELGLSIGVSVYQDPAQGATEEQVDNVVQSLVDHLQEWEGKRPGADVTASKYEVKVYHVGPTDPEPTPDPEPEPV